MHQPLAKTCVFQLWVCTNNIHKTSQRSCFFKSTNGKSHPFRHVSSPWNPLIFSSNFTLEPPSCWGNPTSNLSPKCSQGSGITLVWPFFACKVVLFWVSPGHWRNSFVSLGCEAFWVFFVFLLREWLGLYCIFFLDRSWVTIVTRVSLWRVAKLCFLFYDWVLRPSSPSCVTCAGGLRLNGFNLYNGFLW